MLCVETNQLTSYPQDGYMMNYNKYIESLKNTPEPEAMVRPYAIDYRGLVAYAHELGVEPCNLSDKEKEMFIIKESALAKT